MAALVEVEVLRVIDSLQLTATHQLTTPAQWQPGDDVIIAGSVSDDQAKERYPDGWQQPLPYMRIVCAVARSGVEGERSSPSNALYVIKRRAFAIARNVGWPVRQKWVTARSRALDRKARHDRDDHDHPCTCHTGDRGCREPAVTRGAPR